MKRACCHVLAAAATTCGVSAAELGATTRVEELRQLSIEDIVNTEVTSVLRRSGTLFESPSAVFVISDDDIRRSGARTLPDLLRMVPGMFVTQLDEHSWTVNARGMSKRRFERGLQVLVDGRSVYSPSMAGVYWDAVDYLFEDIERIEVIRGPGGAAWGANAQNGVINIITKPASLTQGGYASIGGGNIYHGFAEVRYGIAAGTNGALRGFVKALNNEEQDSVGDGWSSLQTGIRGDWTLAEVNHLTFEAGFYQGRMGVNRTYADYAATPTTSVLRDRFDASAAYGLATWVHDFGEKSSLTVNSYIDHTDRRGEIPDSITEEKYDVEARHRIPLFWDQDFQYGAGYRYMPSTLKQRNDAHVHFSPETRHEQLVTLFVQDEIPLFCEELKLIGGSRFEHYDPTGWEVLPNARLSWTPSTRNTFWAAVSWGAAVPDRTQRDVAINPLDGPFPSPGNPLPVFFAGTGNRDTGAEKLVSYETGSRWLVTEKLSLDVAAFYNEYTDLVTGRMGSPEVRDDPFLHVSIPVSAANDAEAQTWGVEFAASYQLLENVRISPAYTFLSVEAQDPFNVTESGLAPEHQISLRASWNPLDNLDVDVWWRYVADRPAVNIDEYFDLSARIAYRFSNRWELSIVGQNLLEDERQEAPDPLFFQTKAIPVSRSVYGQLTFRF